MVQKGGVFTEIVLQDTSIVEQLESFLGERETLLRESLLTASSAEQANSLLWEQVELLDGAIQELFIQLDSLDIDSWSPSLLSIIGGCQQLLSRHLAASYAMALEVERRLDSKTTSWWGRWHRLLDKNLLKSMRYAKKVVDQRYSQFLDHYAAYQKSASTVDPHLTKLKDYEVLGLLGATGAADFRRLYRLLKFYENGSQELALQAIRRLPSQKLLALFSRYLLLLEETLFEKSRVLKTTPQQLFSESQGRSFFADALRLYRCELHTLGASVAKYRQLALKTDANPYVRARWGFSDEPVAPEPKYSVDLTELGYSIEELDHLYTQLIHALERGPNGESERLAHADPLIMKDLHLLGQPLLSRGLFHRTAERVLHLLEELDEVGSYGYQLVDYTRSILSRLLRADWRNSWLCETPQFQKLYRWHQKIRGVASDKGHDRRVAEFHRLFRQITEKLHASAEITELLGDLKGELQDFLATLQRSLAEEGGRDTKRRDVAEIAEQLLDYRYLFSRFFATLYQNGRGEDLRFHFLFVDHYFSSMEEKKDKFATPSTD